MRRALVFLSFVSAVAASAGCSPKTAATTTLRSAVIAPATFDWEAPKGWKTETIPFPLEFAPSLPYRGVEEIRFAPQFFKSSAPTYFSYSFAWILDDGASIEASHLSVDLGTYFAGLSHAVNEKRHDARAHYATMTRDGDGRYRGVAHTVDAFGDGRALALNVEGETLLCGAHRVLLLSLSPTPADSPTWAALRAQRATFRCR